MERVEKKLDTQNCTKCKYSVNLNIYIGFSVV